MKPWEKYKTPIGGKPWEKYGGGNRDSFDAGIKIEHPDYDSMSAKQGVSDNAHMIAPMLGTTLGTIIGMAPAVTGLGAAATPYSMVAGGALGTAAGEQFADALDGWMGLSNLDMQESAIQAGENLYEGAKQEAIGLGIAAPVGAIAKRVPKAVKTVRNAFTADNASDLARVKSQQVQKEIGGEFGMTDGMATNNADRIGRERGFIGAGNVHGVDEQFSGMLDKNKQSVSKYINDISDGNVDDMTMAFEKNIADADAGRAGLEFNRVDAGDSIRGKITEAQAPIKETMAALRKQIPDYPMEIGNLKATIKELKADKMLSPNDVADLNYIEKMLSDQTGNGATTHTIFGFDKGLNDFYNKVGGAGRSTAHIMQLKKALRKDFADLSAQARTGQIKVYDGQTYRPDELAQQLENKSVRLAEEQTKLTPDVNAAMKQLKSDGVAPEMYMQNTGIDDASHLASLKKVWGQNRGEFPTIGNQEQVDKLINESKSIQELLGKLEPGQDVASKMAAYNKYAHEKFFQRFDTPTVKAVNKTTRNPENVINLFNNETAFSDMTKAIGKDEAQDAFRKYYQSNLGEMLAKDPSDKALTTWMNKSRRTLHMAGLDKEFSDIVKTQTGYNQAKTILGVDSPVEMFAEILKGNKSSQIKMITDMRSKLSNNPKALEGLRKAFLEYFDDYTTTQLAAGKEGFLSFQKRMKGLDATIRSLMTKEQYKSIQTAREAVNITQRGTKGNSLGGSHTAELLNTKENSQIIRGNDKPSLKAKAGNAAVSTAIGVAVDGMSNGFGGIPAAVGAGTFIRTIQDAAIKRGNEAVWAVFRRAMFDPNYARTLTSAAKGSKEANRELAKLTAYMAGKLTSQKVSGQ